MRWMSEQLFSQIIDELKEIKEEQKEIRKEQVEMRNEQNLMREEQNLMREEQNLMRQEQNLMREEQIEMRQEQKEMRQEQHNTNDRLTAIESTQHIMYGHIGKLTEYYTDIMSRFDQLATKEDFNYLNYKINQHERELYEIKQKM